MVEAVKFPESQKITFVEYRIYECIFRMYQPLNFDYQLAGYSA